MLSLLTKISVLCALSTIASAVSNPYCVRNESTITRTPITKTRLVVKKPMGPFKIFKKTKTYTESYVDYEEHVNWKAITTCCEGYKMSPLKMCEPICLKGCPMYAQCVEPNKCQCGRGYISAMSPVNGSHYCEPICNGGCPENARCAEPDICECERGYHKNEISCVPRCSVGCAFGGICRFPEHCECQAGYKASHGNCVPICSKGDGCQHGNCIDTEHCICHNGYVMNESSQICEKDATVEDFENESEEVYDTTETNNSDELSTDGDLDENEKIFLTTPVNDYDDYTEGSGELNDTTGHKKCPKNFIFYQNMCRPKIFASNEIDCRFKPCGEHALCQANGTCACEEGYDWYKDTEDETVDAEPTEYAAICLTLTEISERLQRDIDSDTAIDWVSACLTALGVLCMLGALAFLVTKFLRRKHEKLNVQAKNDLYCTYDHNNEVPLVL